MMHISDITREKRLNHPREALTAGQKVRASVLELDKERRRIKLGIKQLEPTSADEYVSEHRSAKRLPAGSCKRPAVKLRSSWAKGFSANCRLA